MKRNCKKNIDGRIRQIVSLALRVNRETKHHVFVEYSGHVNLIQVTVYEGGWVSGKNSTYQLKIWMNSEDFCLSKLGRIIAKLKSLLPKNK